MLTLEKCSNFNENFPLFPPKLSYEHFRLHSTDQAWPLSHNFSSRCLPFSRTRAISGCVYVHIHITELVGQYSKVNVFTPPSRLHREKLDRKPFLSITFHRRSKIFSSQAPISKYRIKVTYSRKGWLCVFFYSRLSPFFFSYTPKFSFALATLSSIFLHDDATVYRTSTE